MKVLFLGKDRPAVVKSLRWTLENNYTVVGAVLPEDYGSELDSLIRNYKIPCLKIDNIYRCIETNQFDGVYEALQYLDIVISVMFWRKIKAPLLCYPKYGAINFHPAPLPEYKGLGGYSLAILNQDNRWGITAHYMDTDFDTGNIIHCMEYPINAENETSHSLQVQAMEKMPLLYADIMELVKNQHYLSSYKQTSGKYTSAEQLEKLKIIDLNAPYTKINRIIRAFWSPPWHGAYLEKLGSKITVINEAILYDIRQRYKSYCGLIEDPVENKYEVSLTEDTSLIKARISSLWKTPYDLFTIKIGKNRFFLIDEFALKKIRTFYENW